MVDASVAAAASLFDEPAYTQAIELFDHARNAAAVFWCPEHLLLETASAVTKAARRRRIAHADAEALIRDLERLPVKAVSSVPLIPRAAEISLATPLGFYDALFVALAELLGLPLVTSDDRQAAFARQFARAVGLLDALESLERDA